MNFADWIFWKLLLGGLAVILLARPLLGRLLPAYDRLALAALGLFLLGSVNLLTLGIFLTTLAVTYVGLMLVRNHSRWRRTAVFWVLVPLQLAPLFYYKYADFVVNGVMGADFDILRGLLIPVGLSFYSFQLVGFGVDTLLRGNPLPKPLDMLNFAGFFPQIVAGPIERRDSLLPQVENFRFRWRWDDIHDGLRWMVVGLFFKLCLADNLSEFVLRDTQANAFLVWFSNLVFGLRVYYDFAGYSLIALGVARCLGVRLMLNFASPYCARDIQDFWRRWHISLSTWFRDYVYFPMGGNKTRLWAVNIMVVFVVSGVWHGAGWNFVLWGGIHGALLVAMRWRRLAGLPAPALWLVTMAAVFIAWLCFYETRMDVLMANLASILNPLSYSAAALGEAAARFPAARGVVAAGFLILAGLVLVIEALSLRHGGEPYSLLRKPIPLAIMVILTILLASGDDNAFIYFAF